MTTATPSSPASAPAAGSAAIRSLTSTRDALSLNFSTLAQEQDGLVVEKAGLGRFPVSLGSVSVPNTHAVGMYMVLRDRASHHHTVSLEVGDPQMNSKKIWGFMCGHPWMHGAAVAKQSVEDYRGWAKDTAGLRPGSVDAIVESMDRTFAIAPLDPNCPFLTGSSTSAKFSCEHSRHASFLLSQSEGPLAKVFEAAGAKDLDSLLLRMEEVYNNDRRILTGGGSLPAWDYQMQPTSRPKAKPVPVVMTSVAKPLDPREEAIRLEESRFRSTGRLANQVLDLTSHFNGTPIPVLIAGPGGWGKTFISRDLGQSEKLFEHFAEIPVTPGTEMRDLVGGIYPTIDPVTKEKHFTHVDGPLTKAMRQAQDKRTLLLMDEVGNLDSRGWNMMKNLLNPSRGQYTLSTDAPEQSANGEWNLGKISVPTKNLVVMMTANIGEGYDGALGDPAVRSRLVTIPFGPTRETVHAATREGDPDAKATLAESKDYLMAITKKALAGRGFQEDNAKKFERVWDGAVALVSDDSLYQLPSPRNFARAIEAAASEQDLGKQLLYQSGNWARLRADFYPNQTQAQFAKGLVERNFKITP